jgi:meso-butanediol dehydrogenase / (S,S)-butanediol dehydrogenase / diacetyl reductase
MVGGGAASGRMAGMNRLDGKIALVTGVAGGIGRAAAVLFAQAGARVVGCDMNAAGAAETERLVSEAGGTITVMAPVDLASSEGATAWVNEAAEIYGGVDVLYNNAGTHRMSAFADVTAEDWQFTMRYDLDITFYVTSATWPHMVARGGGSIINMSSMSAIRGAAFHQMAAHGAAKGGVLSLTMHFAAAGGAHRIRANAILPGLIRTPATEADGIYDTPDSPGFQMGAANPLGRTGQPEDVAKLALFLASDDSFYVNGTGIPIDGGQSVVV